MWPAPWMCVRATLERRVPGLKRAQPKDLPLGPNAEHIHSHSVSILLKAAVVWIEHEGVVRGSAGVLHLLGPQHLGLSSNSLCCMG